MDDDDIVDPLMEMWLHYTDLIEDDGLFDFTPRPDTVLIAAALLTIARLLKNPCK